MSHTLRHTEVLQCSADDIWEASKHADQILSSLMPDYFGKTLFLQGQGEPGSIRVLTGGPASLSAGQVKESIDKVDDSTRTLGYTVLEGDPRYSSFSAEMQFVPVAETCTKAIWTAKYEPVGDMGPPEHSKGTATLVFKTLERAVLSSKTMTHTEKLEASPDAIWKACRHADTILTQSIPQYFASTTMVEGEGHGEPGRRIRVVKFGPAVPYAAEVTKRMELFVDESKKLGYTALKGDSRYKYLAATMQFTPGPEEGTTKAIWVATYVPDGDMGPPEHIKDIVVLVWKSLEGAVKAKPGLYNKWFS